MKLRRHQAGFTLLELVVVTAILVVLAGIALPVAGKAWTSAARRATRARLDELAEAALELVRDTGRLPRTVGDLVERPDGVTGWIGPYVATAWSVRDAEGALVPGVPDAWSRPIELEPLSTDRFRLVSRGPDGVPGADDLELVVDCTPLRRETTLRALEEVNRSLAAWDALHPGAPLERDWPRARARLVAEGLLPADPRHERDAWGRPYVPAGEGAWRLASAELLDRAGILAPLTGRAGPGRRAPASGGAP
jgi:general secretion pathway protein G